jgi:hypothetical protein
MIPATVLFPTANTIAFPLPFATVDLASSVHSAPF